MTSAVADDLRLSPECSLSVARREVILGGSRRSLEPRVWDLLMYLIAHRDRNVAKQELLDSVWQTPFVSDSVVARAVMKARQAIGDVTDEPQFIKTIHRVGYRYIGALEESGPAAQSPSGAATQPAGFAKRSPIVACLPVRNGTGDPMLAWVELGLLSLAGKELEAGRRIRVVSVADLLCALGALPPNASLAEKAKCLSEQLQADATFAAELVGSAGSYVMNWQLVSANEVYEGRTQGNEATSVTIEAMRGVMERLSIALGHSDHLDADAKFMNEAFVRAMVAKSQYLYRNALDLFEVCTSMPGCPIEFRCEEVILLGFFGDPKTPVCADMIIKAALRSGDSHAEGIAQTALALFYLYDGEFGQAEAAADRALEILSLASSPLERVHALATRAMVAIRAYEFNFAQRLLREAADVRESVGSVWAQSWLTGQEALIRESEGDTDAAAALYTTCAKVAEANGNLSDQAFALGHLGMLLLGQGDFQVARSMFERAQAAAVTFGSPRPELIVRFNHALCQLRQGDLPGARDFRNSLLDSRFETVRQRDAFVSYLDACLTLLQGEPSLAWVHFGAAFASLGPYQRFWRDVASVLHVHAALLAGEKAKAEEILQVMESHPAFGRNKPKQCAALLTRGLILYADQLRREASTSFNAAASLGATGELGQLSSFALAWVALDEEDLDSFGRHVHALGNGYKETPAGALLEARAAALRADSVALGELLVRIESRGWSETAWGVDAAAICRHREYIQRGGQTGFAQPPLPV